MKLVDILARELKVWPEGYGGYCISTIVEGSYAAWFNDRKPARITSGGWSDIGCVELWLSELPQDHNFAIVTRSQWQAAFDALKAEKVPAWDGVGLPPVDLPCQWHSDSQTGWQEVVVLAYSGESAWIQPKGKPSIIVGNPANFRPIRTPEQIAADEREAGIQALKQIFDSCSDELMPTSNKYLDTLFGAIYDAGYRKLEIVDN